MISAVFSADFSCDDHFSHLTRAIDSVSALITLSQSQQEEDVRYLA